MSLDWQSQQRFAELLKSAQPQLYAYICGLLMNPRDAEDVLQETNSALWKKAALYDPQKPFLAWAYRFARFQTLAYLKRRKRDRLVFNNEFLERVGSEPEGGENRNERMLQAMEACLEHLPPQQRALIDAKYYRGENVSDVAARLGKTANTVSAVLYRIRAALARCVETRLQTFATNIDL